jgi:hypothetical protein
MPPNYIPIEPTGKLYIKNSSGEYLVLPIDAWGVKNPVWVDIKEAGFRFNKSSAKLQKEFLFYNFNMKCEIEK